jgi:GTP-binding protein
MNAEAKLPSVAIIGRPNVGKSALFNRLVGRKIAIVHDQPGITRDRISAICSRGEQPFALWDTGGIFGAGEKDLRGEVRRTAEEALHASDLLLFVVDGKDGLSPIDSDLAANQAIEERRLPDIRTSDDCDARQFCLSIHRHA